MDIAFQNSLNGLMTFYANYALTELLAQTFSAFVVGSNNKEVIANFIKSTSVSDPSMVEAHTHAKEALLKILDSVKTN